MQYRLPRTVFEPEHEQFRDSVRKFLQTEVMPHHDAWEEQGWTPPEIWRRAGEVGLLGTSIPEEYGGAGGDFKYDAVVLEELGRYGCSGPAWDMHAYIIAPFVQAFGSEAQKHEWLPKFASGEAIFSIGLTEPGGGSDLRAIRTSARRDGDGYVINGAKTFITNGHIGTHILLAAKTAPDKGKDGISLFIVDTASPGYRKSKLLKKIGNKAQDTAELFFDDVRVPAANRLGAENDGWRMLNHGLVQERLIVAVRSIGICEAAVEQTIAYTRDRTAFGQKVFDFQNTRFKLAEMVTKLEVTRPFVDLCIEHHAKGTLDMDTAAKAKLWLTDLQDEILDECLQLHGGYGYMWEYPIARAWADARVHRIYAGTNEIMKHIISKAL